MTICRNNLLNGKPFHLNEYNLKVKYTTGDHIKTHKTLLKYVHINMNIPEHDNIYTKCVNLPIITDNQQFMQGGGSLKLVHTCEIQTLTFIILQNSNSLIFTLSTPIFLNAA